VSFLRRRSTASHPGRRRSIFETEIVIADGAELKEQLLAQGLDTDEIVFKYFWPRYAPPPTAGIRSLLNSEQLRAQFDRLVALHGIVQSSVPMPLAAVLNNDREFVGYVLEYVEGVTLQELIADGMLDEARRRLAGVEETVAKLHAKGAFHGDINATNVIAADDGRTLLLDPTPFPREQTKLQDELCLAELRRRVDAPDTSRSDTGVENL
jgi:serine/threonine protein kinase